MNRGKRRLMAASRNPAKVATIARLVAPEWTVAPAPVGTALDDAEDEATFAQNAREKARRLSSALPDELVVATDGGLLVPTLGRAWNPLRTRRFAGAGASDRDRADALLALAARLTGDERRIGWREALAVARDGNVLAVWECEGAAGLLAPDYDPALLAAGSGFWLPALWVCPECGGRRLADLSDAERAGRDDHWARLGEELRRFLGKPSAAEAGATEPATEAGGVARSGATPRPG